MTVRRWDPLRDLLDLQERMNRLFEESLTRGRLEVPPASPSWTPLVDVYETDEAYVVQAELPGISQADIQLRVDGSRVILKGERRLAASTRPDSFHRMERSYGPFERSFVFPAPIDEEKISAVFHEGILRLDLPKMNSRGGHKIPVERGE